MHFKFKTFSRPPLRSHINKLGSSDAIITSGDSTLVYNCNILLLLLLDNELMEHGGIETNELNMTPMGFPVFGLPGF